MRAAAHGLTPLSDDLRKELYREGYNEMNSFSGTNFVSVDTPFSIVDGCLYAQLVDFVDAYNESHDTSSNKLILTYEKIWSDMRKCVDRCHKDGVIKVTVAQNPMKYITYDPNIFPMIDTFRAAGRKVFLLTNSLW